MSRYFFNVYDGTDMFDEDGTDLRGIKEMRLYMLTMATQIISAVENHSEAWQMEVLDERGTIVASMDFGINTKSK